MPDRRDIDFLQDIQEAIQRIATYTAEMDAATFTCDIKTQDAVLRNLEIIGEATKSLPEALRMKYPDVPWRGMAGLRDRLIHHYFGVNLDIVWQIVVSELEDIATRLEVILQIEK